MCKVSQKELEAAFNELFDSNHRVTPDTGTYHVGLEVTVSGRKAHGGKLYTVTHVAKTIGRALAISEAYGAARAQGITRDLVLIDVVDKHLHYTRTPRA